MRRVLCNCALGLCITTGPMAWAETIEARSSVDAVTVFPDRATVTRAAEVSLKTGQHAITLQGLPSGIEPASVAAKGEGTAQVTLVGARLVTTQRETPQDPRIDELQAQLKELDRRNQSLHDTLSILEQEREYLNSIKAASVEQVGKDIITRQPSTQEVAGLFTFLGEALTKNAAKTQETKIAIEDLMQTRNKLQRQLHELGYGRTAETSIVVDVDVQRAGTLALEVSYQLPGASWEPVYEARATATGTTVQLATAALVRQRTGEDWSDATLTLSTARPALGGRMPELTPWYLSRWEPPVIYDEALGSRRMDGRLRAQRAAAKMAPELTADMEVMADAFEEQREEATVAQAAVESRGPAVQFVIARRDTVASDGQPRKVPITQSELPADLAYEATPKLSPYAYLRAKVTNKSAAFFVARHRAGVP